MRGNSTKQCLGWVPKPILDSPRLTASWTKPLLASCSVALLAFVVIVLVGPATAQNRTEDPLGLVIGYDVTTLYSLGEDIWEVWICESPNSDLEISAFEVTALLESEMVPYFDWLSRGRYSPVFRAGDPGKVTAPGFAPCLDAIEDLSKPGTEGVIALVNQEANFAQGDPGGWEFRDQETIKLDGSSYPDNGRNVFGGSGLVTLPPNQVDGMPPLISILAHELGHGLWFPHSYRFDPGDYDNPMDIMSDAEVAPGLQVGTIAFNRYAAGWINQDEVEVYSGSGRQRYTLTPPGADGTQMLVIRSGDDGFITLGARVRKGYDSGIPKEGVESYYIYTEALNCGQPESIPCFGLDRPTQAVIPTPTVPLDYFDSVGHVMDVGDGHIYGDISVRLVEKNGDNFVIEVTDEPLNTGVIRNDASPPSNVEPLPDFHAVNDNADPLNLIAGYNVTTAYALDEDLWEVWICRAPDGYLDISAEKAVSLLTSRIVPYFREMSGGRYQPVFRVGGSVSVEYGSDTWEYHPEYGNCDFEVDKAVRSRALNPLPEGLIKIIDTHAYENIGGIGDTGITQSGVLALYANRSPDNNRDVHLSGAIIATPDAVPESAVVNEPYLTVDLLQWLSIAAHELGHALGFPHSQMFSEYDNPMDVMSGVNEPSELRVGTIAINRYAAGWIDASEVAIFDGQGIHRYRLSPPGGNNTQMLVIRSNGSGYLTLGTRIQKGLDSLIPKEGVEVYLVDEQSPECSLGFHVCIYNHRYTRAVPTHPTIPLDLDDRLAHVMDVGDGFTTWNDISVTVVERSGDDFVVEVSGNWFTDDDGNVHETNIATIVALGVSMGCGDPEDHLYCPSRTVTRAQMATFLIRALGETVEEDLRVSRFSDVPPGAWYLGYVERLADLNIARTATGGAFRPSDPLTRLEMAVWMTRAFDSVNEVSPQGVFDDVPADARYAGAVEGIRAAGITRGCSAEPPSYCPDDPVRRDQMASFLGRALAAQGS